MRTFRSEWDIPKKVGSKTSRNDTLDYASYDLNDLMANLEGFSKQLASTYTSTHRSTFYAA